MNAETEDCAAALMFAAKEGHAETVKLLNSKLLSVAKAGDTAKVEQLLKNGADVNTETEKGTTALMFAASGGHTETVKALIKEGADVNAKNEYGGTALLLATYGGHTEIVELLKQVEANNGDINSKLLSAAKAGDTSAVEQLL